MISITEIRMHFEICGRPLLCGMATHVMLTTPAHDAPSMEAENPHRYLKMVNARALRVTRSGDGQGPIKYVWASQGRATSPTSCFHTWGMQLPSPSCTVNATCRSPATSLHDSTPSILLANSQAGIFHPLQPYPDAIPFLMTPNTYDLQSVPKTPCESH